VLKREVFVRHRYPHLVRGQKVPPRVTLSLALRFSPWIAASTVFHICLFGILAALPSGLHISFVGSDYSTFSVSEIPARIDVQRADRPPIHAVKIGNVVAQVPQTDVFTLGLLPRMPADYARMKHVQTAIQPVEFSYEEPKSSAATLLLDRALRSPQDEPVCRAAGHDALSIVGDLKKRLVELHNSSRGLCVVYAIDRTASMAAKLKDTGRYLRAAIESLAARGGLDKSLLTGIVSFSDGYTDLCLPTGEQDRLSKVLDSFFESALDENDQENLMGTVKHCIDVLEQYPAGRKAIVIMTDEKGDDWSDLEGTLALARKSHVTVFAIARESPFIADVITEEVHQEEAGIRKTMSVNVGPESALPEVPSISLGEWVCDDVSSGFGPYALSRLVRETKGKLYLLRTRVDSSDSSDEWECERDVVAHYQPGLTSLDDYEQMNAEDPLRRIITSVQQQWDRESREFAFWQTLPSGELSAISEWTRLRLSLCNDLIEKLRETLPSNSKVRLMPRRRWIALGDLLLAKLTLARYRLSELRIALENAMQHESIEPREARILRAHDKGSDENLERNTVILAFTRVVKRHEGTPWAKVAQDFLKRQSKELYAWRIQTLGQQ